MTTPPPDDAERALTEVEQAFVDWIRSTGEWHPAVQAGYLLEALPVALSGFRAGYEAERKRSVELARAAFEWGAYAGIDEGWPRHVAWPEEFSREQGEAKADREQAWAQFLKEHNIAPKGDGE